MYEAVFGIWITSSNLWPSKSWFVIIKVLAPLVITSWILLIDFPTKLGTVITETTVTPSSISAIGPCFNSPEG